MPEQSQSSGLAFNPGYFKLTLGVLNIVQLVVGLVCLILANGIYTSVTGFFHFGLIFAFISSVVWLVIHLISLDTALQQLPINWVLTELLNTAIMALTLGISSLVFVCVLATGYSNYYSFARNMAAGVLSLLNTAAYVASSSLLLKQHRQQ